MVATRTTTRHDRPTLFSQLRTVTIYEQLSPKNGPKLKVDREKGIIFGVKVAGRFSGNTHGNKGVDGSEYTRACYESALPMYEGAKVRTNHPPRENPDAERSVYDALGVLREPFLDNGDGQNYGVRANLHLVPSHPLAKSVMDDAEFGLGVYGLSHNADWKVADVKGNRFVIEQLDFVRGVDLVDKPATNKNLQESQETRTVKHTLKSILEARQKKFSAPRIAWSKRLLEMDGMAEPLAAETGDMPADADPDEALKAAFQGAGGKILTGMFDGSVDEAEGFKKLKELMKTHVKLTAAAEPETPVEESEEEDDDEKKKKAEGKDASESIRAENKKLKDELAVRTLCEAEKFIPSKTQVRVLSLMESDTERKAAVKEFKVAAEATRKAGEPKSWAGGGAGGTALESGGGGKPATAEAQLAMLRRG